MASRTAAQEEFDTIITKASSSQTSSYHPSDSADYRYDQEPNDLSEDDAYNQEQIDQVMRIPVPNRGVRAGDIRLPHRDFDRGRTTGVKGVIADARSFEDARRSESWQSRHPALNSSNQIHRQSSTAASAEEEGTANTSDDEEFIERWRQSRRDELVREGTDIRNRRMSPSVRRYGRFDEVDAMGYLDAIEKVTRETVVVVFIYDSEVSFISRDLYGSLRINPVCCVPGHFGRFGTSCSCISRRPLRSGPL